MRGFAKFILGKFFDLYKTNPMVVVELLFWKTNTECYEMVEGYGSLNVKRLAFSYLFSFVRYLHAFFI